jgi:molecular chaperone GrpE
MSKKKPTVVELTEALQRERADALNLRRRHEEQVADLKNLVKAHVIHELLPALDNLERSLKHTPKDLAKHDYVKGVQGVAKQFDGALSNLGVERIKTIGEEFDPKLHEAVGVEEGDGLVEVVCEELQPGYRLGDEVIRHARVRVKMEDRK